MIYPPIPLIRQKVIVRKLRASGAVSEDTAKTFAEAGVLNPNAFPGITERMIKKGIIKKPWMESIIFARPLKHIIKASTH